MLILIADNDTKLVSKTIPHIVLRQIHYNFLIFRNVMNGWFSKLRNVYGTITPPHCNPTIQVNIRFQTHQTFLLRQLLLRNSFSINNFYINNRIRRLEAKKYDITLRKLDSQGNQNDRNGDNWLVGMIKVLNHSPLLPYLKRRKQIYLLWYRGFKFHVPICGEEEWLCQPVYPVAVLRRSARTRQQHWLYE